MTIYGKVCQRQHQREKIYMHYRKKELCNGQKVDWRLSAHSWGLSNDR